MLKILNCVPWNFMKHLKWRYLTGTIKHELWKMHLLNFYFMVSTTLAPISAKWTTAILITPIFLFLGKWEVCNGKGVLRNGLPKMKVICSRYCFFFFFHKKNSPNSQFSSLIVFKILRSFQEIWMRLEILIIFSIPPN